MVLLDPGGDIIDGAGDEVTPGHLHSFEFPLGTRKEEVKKNKIKENTLLIPLNVVITDAYPETQWLEYGSEVTGYVIIIILDSFHSRGETRSYAFACLPKPRGMRSLSMKAHYVSYGGGGEKGKLVQILRKCDKYRG